jgi:lysophospholipase L1-like esterase
VIGASDADGVGSSVVCLPWTECPNGTGYPFVAARQLQSQGFKVTVTNLGIPTAVIGPTFQSLGQRYGREIVGNFVDHEMPFVSPSATLVTIFAGPNDLNTITAALGAGAGGSDQASQAAYIDQQLKVFAADFTRVLSGVRNRAPAAQVIVLNVPNLAGLPYLASASAQQKRAAQLLSVGMTTTVINPLTAQGVDVIDLMCDSRLYQPSTFSSDGFHPNDSGYRILADEVVRAFTSSTYPAPKSTCSFMTLVS